MIEEKYVSPILDAIRGSSTIESDLSRASELAKNYIKNVNHIRVFPNQSDLDNLNSFDKVLPDLPTTTAKILSDLDTYGSKTTVAQTGGRYFGFVNGGILPSALCARWLSDAWDQNAALYVISPISSKLEEICEEWLVDLLNFPKQTAVGFVSGSSMASMCGMLAGRNQLLANLGHDVYSDGLFGAPALKVVLAETAHSTIYKALSILGFGKDKLIKVPTDSQGRMRVDKIPPLDNRTLLILQAGNVNSGSFDRFDLICQKANNAGAWVHVDGAFGLWVAASSKMAHLASGLSLADSWSMDAHKTLNAPYDNGIVLCKHKDALVNAMHMSGSYIIYNENRDGMLYTPEMSRRARAVDIWATLMGLGKKGVAQLVEELHAKAKYFAQCLQDNGLEVLNDVVFNQVLVRNQTDEKTEELVKRIQQSGVCWMGGAKWHGQSVMRISICSYKTTYRDIDMCVDEILRIIG